MQLEEVPPPLVRPRSSKAQSASLLPELDVFLHLLVLLRLLDTQNLEKVGYLPSPPPPPPANCQSLCVLKITDDLIPAAVANEQGVDQSGCIQKWT